MYLFYRLVTWITTKHFVQVFITCTFLTYIFIRVERFKYSKSGTMWKGHKLCPSKRLCYMYLVLVPVVLNFLLSDNFANSNPELTLGIKIFCTFICVFQIWSHRLHKSKVTHVEWSPREDWLFCTASCDQTVKFWDVRMIKGRESSLVDLKHTKPVNSGNCMPEFPNVNDVVIHAS